MAQSILDSSKSASWKALQIFSLYRVVLAFSLLIIFNLNLDVSFFGNQHPKLYLITAKAFSGFSLVAVISVFFIARFYSFQLKLQILFDIIFILLLMHASGGVGSGLGMLIAVSTSAVSILIGTPATLGFSVLASLGVLAQQLYSNYLTGSLSNNMTQVGILSVTFMATSLIAYYLSHRLKESENVAAESARGLENMEKLNEQIIQFMNTGVIVVDGANRIALINRAAWVHLGMPESSKSQMLEQVSTPLARQLNLWRRKHSYRSKPFKNNATGPNLLPNFSDVSKTKQSVIIFLEDTSMLNQRAQSLKLASLGRLTASIAHEIRNPLGALSHAAQLLNESDEISPENADLVDIIHKNTSRVNTIIENIMKLSQRKAVQVKEINLSRYLPKMLEDYVKGKKEPPLVATQFQSNDLIIHFDVSQLSQVLTNLIDNGARYSELKTGKPTVQIMVGVEPHSHTSFLDVIDQGDGITPEVAEKLFEPFFTTSRTGTGLGLYLSKELCEVNRARLDHIPIPTGGTCFRISFSAANLTQR